MKKLYNVYFETSVCVQVEAKSKEEAEELAYKAEIPNECLEWSMLDETKEASKEE